MASHRMPGVRLARMRQTSKPCRRRSSEKKLQRELDLPRTKPSRGDNSSCRWKRCFPIGASREDLPGDIREGKVGVVENVEEFRPELQCPALAQLLDRGIFYQREVQVRHARTGQNISSRVSQ